MSLSSTVLIFDACWRTCAAHCGGRFETCVEASALNHRRVGGDRCDLSCQKRCCAYGGPLLDITGPLVAFPIEGTKTVLLNIGKCLFRFLLHRGRFHGSPGTDVS